MHTVAGLSGNSHMRGCGGFGPKALHITLHFIAEAGEPFLTAVSAKLRARLAAIESSSAILGRPDHFRRRVMIYSIEDHGGLLRGLYQTISAVITEEGMPTESRQFRPHLTMARMKPGEVPDGLLQRHQEVVAAATPFPITEVGLIESKLRPGGSEYSVLEAFPLSDSAVNGPRRPRPVTFR